MRLFGKKMIGQCSIARDAFARDAFERDAFDCAAFDCDALGLVGVFRRLDNSPKIYKGGPSEFSNACS